MTRFLGESYPRDDRVEEGGRKGRRRTRKRSTGKGMGKPKGRASRLETRQEPILQFQSQGHQVTEFPVLSSMFSVVQAFLN